MCQRLWSKWEGEKETQETTTKRQQVLRGVVQNEQQKLSFRLVPYLAFFLPLDGSPAYLCVNPAFLFFAQPIFFSLSLFSSLTLCPSFFLFLPLSFSPGRVSALNILGSVNTRRDGRAVKVRTRNDEKTLL